MIARWSLVDGDYCALLLVLARLYAKCKDSPQGRYVTISARKQEIEIILEGSKQTSAKYTGRTTRHGTPRCLILLTKTS